MKSLSKKLLSIFMVLCLTFLAVGFTVNVKAATGDVVFTIYGDERGYDDNVDVPADKSLTVSNNTMSYHYQGVKTKKDSSKKPFAYGYIMYINNKGFIYSTATIPGYYPSKVSVTFGSNTGTGGKVGATFGTAQLSSRNTKVSTGVTKGSTVNFTNNVQTNLYWNFSTCDANVQITDISVTYSPINTGLKALPVPTATYDDSTKMITVTSALNATGYRLAVYASETETKPLKTYDFTGSSFKVEFTSQGSFILKLMAIGDNKTNLDSNYSGIIGTYTNDKAFPITIVEFLALPAQQENDPNLVYYQLTGIITELKDATTGRITIKDETGSIYMHTLTETKGGAADSIKNQNLKVNDTITIIGYRMEYGKNHTPQVGGAYFVSKTIDYVAMFSNLKTLSSLNVSYNTTQEEIQVPGTENISMVFGENKWEDGSAVTDVALSPSTKLIGEKYNHGSLTPKYYDHDFTLRSYKGNRLTITSTKTIESIQLLFKEGQNNIVLTNGTASADTNTLTTTITPTDGAKDVIIDNTDAFRLLNIKVTVTGEPTVSYKNIYEVEKDIDLNNKNKIGLRFGTQISTELFDHLFELAQNDISFGVAYAKSSELNGKTFDAALKDKSAHFEECSPVSINEQGEIDTNGSIQQFAVVLNHIPNTSFNDEVTAACYVCIDGVYYTMQTSTYSVNTLAKNYVDTQATNPAVAPHVEMLKWLSKVTA